MGEVDITWSAVKRQVLNRLEQEYFRMLRDACGGNVSEMARRSGLERQRVRRYLRLTELRLPDDVASNADRRAAWNRRVGDE
jgi:ActR/RegA family two-component response regulator